MLDNSNNINVNLPQVDPNVQKQAYKDLAHPGAVQVGTALETIGLAVNKLLSPIRHWATSGQENMGKLQLEVTKKLAAKNITEPIEPPNHIAIPIILANSYTSNDTLRKLYASLLAHSMDTSTQHQTHPAFVEIIKQLTPDEAWILKTTPILQHNTPICEIRLQVKSNYNNSNNFILHQYNIIRNRQAGKPLLKYYTNFSAPHAPQDISFMIDNFLRLKLLEKPSVWETLLDRHAYEHFYYDDYTTEIYHSLANDTNCPDGLELAHIPGYVEVTDFGRRFYDICVK